MECSSKSYTPFSFYDFSVKIDVIWFIFAIFAPYLERPLNGDEVSLIYPYVILWDLNSSFYADSEV